MFKKASHLQLSLPWQRMLRGNKSISPAESKLETHGKHLKHLKCFPYFFVFSFITLIIFWWFATSWFGSHLAPVTFVLTNVFISAMKTWNVKTQIWGLCQNEILTWPIENWIFTGRHLVYVSRHINLHAGFTPVGLKAWLQLRGSQEEKYCDE